MLKWKVDKRVATWAVVFGVAATLTGMFLLRAVRGGFLAEGFFLIVVSWIVFPILVARLIARLGKRTTEEYP